MNEYLYDILLPIADSFKDANNGEPFRVISTREKCRISFINKKVDTKWVEFCSKYNLDNDTSLEY